MSETDEQARLVKYLIGRRWVFTATANGVRTSASQCRVLARTGVAPGVPDVLIFEPLGGFVGVAIEMKREKGGRVSPEQKRWLHWLEERGWRAFVSHGAETASEELEKLANAT